MAMTKRASEIVVGDVIVRAYMAFQGGMTRRAYVVDAVHTITDDGRRRVVIRSDVRTFTYRPDETVEIMEETE